MVTKSLVTLLLVGLLMPLTGGASTAAEREHISLGRWTRDELDRIIRNASRIKDRGRRIEFLSRQFLRVGYEESTLIGDPDTPEAFVVNLGGVDCFTYIDYIEAMRLSSSFAEFKEKLKQVRYRGGKVSFETRNHFFTDWREFNSARISDVTDLVGGSKTERVLKRLNLKEDGTLFLPGITPREREIRYIPSDALDEEVLSRLRTGDYVGIYTEREGLDVSHTGIVIREGDRLLLRHASSREGKRGVVDEDLIDYLSKTPGLVVLRPKD